MTTLPSSPSKNINPVSKPEVSDHALLRYLERAVGIPVEEFRAVIAENCAPAIAVHARRFSKDGLTYAFRDNRVLTVLPSERPSSNHFGAQTAKGIKVKLAKGLSRREAAKMHRRSSR